MAYLVAPFIAAAYKKQGEPLCRIVSKTAARYGFSEAAVARALSYFIENATLELDHGNAVHVRGFGTFQVVNYEPRKPGAVTFCRVFFFPSRRLQRLVSSSAPPRKETRELFQRYRRHHAPWHCAGRGHERVFTAMAAWRRQLAKLL